MKVAGIAGRKKQLYRMLTSASNNELPIEPKYK
jgi:hypothetical protein